MSETANWYVVKVAAENCQIVSSTELEALDASEKWGPYRTQGEAIANGSA